MPIKHSLQLLFNTFCSEINNKTFFLSRPYPIIDYVIKYIKKSLLYGWGKGCGNCSRV